MTKIEEIKLLSQCALADNRCAFGKLVEAYQPRVRRFLLNLTLGNEAFTDDLAQETFLKAYLNIRSFRGLSSFGTWLFRIALNCFYSEQRRRRETPVDNFDETMQPYNSDATEATDSRLTVQEALKQLTHNERVAISLFYIEDLPVKKIASITGMSESAIKSTLFRGKAKMKEFLTHHLTDPS